MWIVHRVCKTLHFIHLLFIALQIKINKNKNDVKLNSTQSFNINSINQTSNLGQNLSHNNDSSFSNNGYNSVLENLLDHLDLSQKGWTSKLVSRIENALSNGGEEIEFNLKPKNLGILKVSVSQKNGMNTVKIIAENRSINLLEDNPVFPSFEIPEPQITGQESRITTPNLTSPASVDPAVVQSQNVSSTLPANFASLPTAQRAKIIEDFLRS